MSPDEDQARRIAEKDLLELINDLQETFVRANAELERLKEALE